MSYLGNTPSQQTFVAAVDYFNGNGSTVAFTLSRPVASVAQVTAVIENVPQNPGSAFTVNGNTITFTSAPPSGTSNIYVYYTSPITQVIAPSDGTVGAVQMASGAALANIGAGGVTSTYLASGAARANFGAGAVLQVVSAVNTSALGINAATSPVQTLYDTGTQAVITPQSATSKVLILVQQSYFHESAGAQGTGFRINRNGTDVTSENGFTASYQGPNRVHGYHAMQFLDSPATTSAITYKVRAMHWGNNGSIYYQYGSTQSQSNITLIEVAA